MLPATKKKPNILGRTENRYEQILRDLLLAKKRKPGERMVTASATAFIEKRAALQEKTSALTWGALKAGLKKVWKPLSGTEGSLIGPKGLAIGGTLLGLGHLTSPLLERIGYGGRAVAYPDLYQRMRMDEEAAESFANSVGKEVGKKTVGLAGDLLSKFLNVPSQFMQGRTQQSVFDQLRGEDDVLSQASPEDLQEAYHTMARFAPTLATDANAVKTFLRESTLYGTGPNFMSIKQLADAERAVNPIPGGES